MTTDYTFLPGDYRVRIKSELTENNSSITHTMYSNNYNFNVLSDNIYYHFKSNPNVKVGMYNYNVPNASLIESGTYKGINYAIYSNKVCVLSGTQTEEINDVTYIPWRNIDIDYLYCDTYCIGGPVCSHNRKIKDIAVGFNFQITHLSYITNPHINFFGGECNTLDLTFFNTLRSNNFAWLFSNCSVMNYCYGLENLSFANAISTSGTFDLFNPHQDLDLYYTDLPVSCSCMFNMSLPAEYTLTLHLKKIRSALFNQGSQYSATGQHTINFIIDDPVTPDDLIDTYSHLLGAWDIFNVKKLVLDSSLHSLAYSVGGIKVLNFEHNCGFNTQNITNFTWMFNQNSSLQAIYDYDNGFNFDNAFYTREMFEGCTVLSGLYTKDLNTQEWINKFSDLHLPKVTDARGMFRKCNSLPSTMSLTIGEQLTQSCNYSLAFEECANLTNLTINIYNLYKANPNFTGLCRKCANLTTFNLILYASSGDIITQCSSAFEDCTSLKRFAPILDSSIQSNTSISFGGTSIFKNCSSLEYIDLSLFEYANFYDTEVFLNCNSLTTLITSEYIYSNTVPTPLPKTMYDSFGNVYTEFPAGTTHIGVIVLTATNPIA